MSLDESLRRRLDRRLTVPDRARARAAAAPTAPSAAAGLTEDARRLWQRVQSFAASKWGPHQVDEEALELACIALQLPLTAPDAATDRAAGGGRLALRDRAQRAVPLLIAALSETPITRAPSRSPRNTANGMTKPPAADLLARTTRLLAEVAQRPASDEARLLADAVNLEDFGAMGLARQAMQLGRRGQSVAALLEGVRQREQYAYWQARLKDGFHFAPVRELARRRLDHYRKAASMIEQELNEDGAA